LNTPQPVVEEPFSMWGKTSTHQKTMEHFFHQTIYFSTGLNSNFVA